MGVGGVVQHAVAHDHVEGLRREGGLEQVHLHEAHVVEALRGAESFGEAQRVQAQVGAGHAPRADAEEVRQLPRAATHFEHGGVVGDLLVQEPRVDAAPRLGQQRLHALAFVVVREGLLLVEGLDRLGDVALHGLVRVEEAPDAFFARVGPSATAATRGVVRARQHPAAARTGPARGEGRIHGSGLRGPHRGLFSSAPSAPVGDARIDARREEGAQRRFHPVAVLRGGRGEAFDAAQRCATRTAQAIEQSRQVWMARGIDQVQSHARAAIDQRRFAQSIEGGARRGLHQARRFVGQGAHDRQARRAEARERALRVAQVASSRKAQHAAGRQRLW